MRRIRTLGGPRGITLLELMVAITIVAGLLAISLYAVAQISSAGLRAEAMRVSGALRLVYGRAAINGTRYQLIIDLDSETYWAECSDEQVALVNQNEADAVTSFSERARRYDSDDEESDPFGLGDGAVAGFDDCSEPLLGRRTLRRRVGIERVLALHQEDVAEEGQTAIGFFPNGYVERTMIWLRDASGSMITLTIEPMTGRVRVHAGDLEVPEDFFEVEEEDG